jgi:putative flippase GtrA
MKALLEKYRGLILYVVFGALTTVINIAAYALCYRVLHLPNVPSNVVAWVLAVLFAFVTNKLYVFESKSLERGTVLRELLSFVGARLATGLLDLAVMFVGVDVLHGPDLVFKVASNIVVILLNYVFSKLIVFRKK